MFPLSNSPLNLSSGELFFVPENYSMVCAFALFSELLSEKINQR
jgi:hypothetical protein